MVMYSYSLISTDWPRQCSNAERILNCSRPLSNRIFRMPGPIKWLYCDSSASKKFQSATSANTAAEIVGMSARIRPEGLFFDQFLNDDKKRECLRLNWPLHPFRTGQVIIIYHALKQIMCKGKTNRTMKK